MPQAKEHNGGNGIMALDLFNRQAVAILMAPLHPQISTQGFRFAISRDDEAKVDHIVLPCFPFVLELPQCATDKDVPIQFSHVGWHILWLIPSW